MSLCVMVERDVVITMRDGAKLMADIYRPARDGKPVEDEFPIILVRTLYDKDDVERFIDAEAAARRGYAVVVQDVRGRFNSDGNFYHGIYEAEDGYDTIEWAAEQGWCNGKIGMTGRSYLAALQSAAAVLNPPHLTSLFHVKAPSSYYKNGFRHGGALLLYTMCAVFKNAGNSKEALADAVFARALTEAWTNAPEWLTRMPLKPGLTPVSLAPSYERWLFDVLGHVDYDDYWKDVPLWEPELSFDEYADACGFYVGGWYDMYREDTFYTGLSGRKSKPLKLLMGPWTHFDFGSSSGEVDFGPDAVIDAQEYNDLQLSWFDQTLKGEHSGILDEAPVKIFVMGGGDGRRNQAGRLNHGGKWRLENEWPLTRTQYTKYYLHSGGRLGTLLPDQESAASFFTYDPKGPVPSIGGTRFFLSLVPGEFQKNPPPSRWKLFVPYGAFDQRERTDFFACKTNLPLSSRQDVLVFVTEPLEADLEVTGPISVKLSISSSVVDTDFTAKLIDVYPSNPDYPNGFSMNLTESILRVRYRNGFESPELMKPGEIYEITIELPAVSNLFVKGHQIRLDISSSSYPNYDLNPNTGDPYLQGGRCVVAENTVHHDAARPSHILLPVIPRKGPSGL